ncbi:hypothetical protein HPG69_010358, partial [Diceros bicornis minor]
MWPLVLLLLLGSACCGECPRLPALRLGSGRPRGRVGCAPPAPRRPRAGGGALTPGCGPGRAPRVIGCPLPSLPSSSSSPWMVGIKASLKSKKCKSCTVIKTGGLFSSRLERIAGMVLVGIGILFHLQMADNQGSAQLIFNITKSVEYTVCNESVIIPCFVNNVEAKSITEMYVKWKFKGKDIYTYSGQGQKTTNDLDFKSATITASELLKGIASLKMDKRDARVGNYTCEVTELSREGETIIELKYRVDFWSEDCCVDVSGPGVTCSAFLFAAVKTLKYKSNPMKGKTIFLFVAGLVLTIDVIVGAILFIPGEFSTKNAWGLGLIVIPTATLTLLQYCVFSMSFGMSSSTIAILILQVLGFVLSVVGLSLCISECTPVHGPLLISGLGIIALAELVGLVYMKFFAYVKNFRCIIWKMFLVSSYSLGPKNILSSEAHLRSVEGQEEKRFQWKRETFQANSHKKTIQTSRKAVEEPLN